MALQKAEGLDKTFVLGIRVLRQDEDVDNDTTKVDEKSALPYGPWYHELFDKPS